MKARNKLRHLPSDFNWLIHHVWAAFPVRQGRHTVINISIVCQPQAQWPQQQTHSVVSYYCIFTHRKWFAWNSLIFQVGRWNQGNVLISIMNGLSLEGSISAWHATGAFSSHETPSTTAEQQFCSRSWWTGASVSRTPWGIWHVGRSGDIQYACVLPQSETTDSSSLTAQHVHHERHEVSSVLYTESGALF